MPKWKWEGFDKKKQKVSGTLEAKSVREVRQALRSQGIRPLRVEAPSVFEVDLGQLMIDKGMAKGFGNKELTNFTNQLSTLLNAGVPILQSIEILKDQEKHPMLKKALEGVIQGVAGGKSFSESLETQKGFDKLYCNLVKAGELGGILDEILDKLSEYMEKQEKTKSQIKSALTYPFLVVVVGIGVIWGLLVFVVPKFVDMIKDTGQEVPWITQTVIDISDFLAANGVITVVGAAVIGTVFKKWATSPKGKPVFDRFIINFPIFGNIVIKGNLGSFSRTLSTMLGAGVPLIDSLDICRDTVDNAVIAKDILFIKKFVTEGKTLTEPIMRIKYFPAMVGQMIKVGESTGNLDSMLLKVAQIFENEVGELIDGATKLVEPLILVVLGGVIGFVLIAMYMPIFMSAGG